MPTDVEQDPFLLLLTDALRAGPGSPEWREAVAKLKSGGESVDEYRLLIDAREALESGRDYRSVRAGPGFTRRLMNNLEAGRPAPARSFPVTGFIAGIAVLVIAAIIGIAIHELYRGGSLNPLPHANIDELAGTYLPNVVLTTEFGSGIPAAWRTIGRLPVEAVNGLAPAQGFVVPDGDYVGGGVVVSAPVPADQTFSVSVTIQIRKSGEALIPQVFIANSPDFSSDRATAAQELVWELEGAEQKAVVGGRVERQARIPDRTQLLTVRLIVNRDLAIVESGEKDQLWAGPNGLGDGPRYIGVRFIQTSGKSDDDIKIQSVHIQKS